MRLADVAVGTELPEQVFRVTRADLVRYAGASGDFNPIHWNERVATAVGLPGVIAHGMFTMALAGRAVTDWTGDPGALVEYQVRFGRPVVVPDDDDGAEVTVRGKVGAAARGRPGRGSTSPSPAAARRCCPWPARSSAWHERGAAGRPARGRGAAPRRLHLLRRHRRGAGRGRPDGPRRRPRRGGGCPAGSAPSPTRTGRVVASISASPTTCCTVTGTETGRLHPRPAADELVFRLVPNGPTPRRPATGWSSTPSAGTTSPAARTRRPAAADPGGLYVVPLDGGSPRASPPRSSWTSR